MNTLQRPGQAPLNIMGFTPGRTTRSQVESLVLKRKAKYVDIDKLVDANHLKVENLRMLVACLKPDIKELHTKAEGLTYFFYKDVLESLQIHLPRPLGKPPKRLANGYRALGDFISRNLFGEPPSLVQMKSSDIWQLGWFFEPYHFVLTLDWCDQFIKKPMVYLIYGNNDLLLLKEKEERNNLKRFKKYFKKQMEQ